jgi:hypothetical protein
MHTTYEFTVPLFIKLLSALKEVLLKGEILVREKGLDEGEFLGKRLAPDMFPLSKQVQVSCDHAKGAVSRLAGVTPPKFEDTEKTFADLQARIDKTLAYLRTITLAQFAEVDERKIELPNFSGKYMLGFAYAREYAIPNFLFHVTTAYNLIRLQGATVGKADFVGALPFKDK